MIHTVKEELRRDDGMEGKLELASLQMPSVGGKEFVEESGRAVALLLTREREREIKTPIKEPSPPSAKGRMMRPKV